MKSSLKNHSKQIQQPKQVRCNICDRWFRASSVFNRFCKTCKAENELFKFYEWLPQN